MYSLPLLDKRLLQQASQALLTVSLAEAVPLLRLSQRWMQVDLLKLVFPVMVKYLLLQLALVGTDVYQLMQPQLFGKVMLTSKEPNSE